MQSVRISRNVPLECFDHSLCLGGRGDDRLRDDGSFGGDDGAGILRAPFESGLLQGGQKISHRVRFAHDADRQAYPKHALDAQDQLGPAEAVDAEIAIEPAGQRNIQRSRARSMKLTDEIGHNSNQTRRQ
jgi:hypothetical protein